LITQSGAKINIDNETCSDYPDDYRFCEWVLQYEADTQSTIFDLSALKKKCLLYLFHRDGSGEN